MECTLQEEEGARKKQAAAKVKKAKKANLHSKSKAAAEPPPEASPACSASASGVEQSTTTSANRNSWNEGAAAGAAVSGSLVADKLATSAVTTKEAQQLSATPTKPGSILPHWMVCILTKVNAPEDTSQSCMASPALLMKCLSSRLEVLVFMIIR